MSIQVGCIVEGLITGITDFGAFVELGEGVTGLVHISEVAHSYVKDIHNHLKVDEKVKVKIISVGDDGKIGLSIKQLLEVPRKNKPDSLSFEDKLAKFFKESDEKLQELSDLKSTKKRNPNRR